MSDKLFQKPYYVCRVAMPGSTLDNMFYRYAIGKPYSALYMAADGTWDRVLCCKTFLSHAEADAFARTKLKLP